MSVSSSRSPPKTPRPSRSGQFGKAVHSRLMKALNELPRRLFLPAEAATVSDDQPAPLGNGRFVPPVDVVALMLEALDLQGSERVLDIGSGSGYQAALLGRLAREVISIEIDEALAERSASVLMALGCNNVRVIHADASAGWPENAPYQAIVVGAAATRLPTALIDQLELGGRLVVALGDDDAQLVERLCKHVDRLACDTVGACRLDMLSSPQRTPSSFPWAAHKK